MGHIRSPRHIGGPISGSKKTRTPGRAKSTPRDSDAAAAAAATPALPLRRRLDGSAAGVRRTRRRKIPAVWVVGPLRRAPKVHHAETLLGKALKFEMHWHLRLWQYYYCRIFIMIRLSIVLSSNKLEWWIHYCCTTISKFDGMFWVTNLDCCNLNQLT